jgi:5'-nucleotidase
MTGRTRQILITNDDGVRAPGLRALAERASELGEVTVIAPDREQSGAAHALTIRQPLRVDRVAERWFAVEGTPTDCVNLAFFHLLDRAPDLVLSGINAGYNLGDDITYSGTVAGAMEGRILGAPGVAVSADPQATASQLDLAALHGVRVAGLLLDRGLPDGSFLNVNVPPSPRGMRLTHQGRREGRDLIAGRDPKGRDYFWVGLVQSSWRPDPAADHAAVEEGYVSVTPLSTDMTCRESRTALEAWSWPEGDAP